MAGIRTDTSQLERWFSKAENKSKVAVKMYAQQGANKFQNYAKQNAMWTDRTGHARQRLTGYIEYFSNKVRINIAHGVDYGIFLELCNEQRYAILNRTVQANSKEVLDGYKNLLRYLV